MNFKLKDDHDLDLSTGNLVLIEGTDERRQQLLVRLSTFKREWFLDRRIGIDYFGQILIKNPKTNVVVSTFRKAILSVDGITAVNDLQVVLGPTRNLLVDFVAQTVEGPITFSDEEFII